MPISKEFNQVYSSPEVLVLNVLFEGCIAGSTTSGNLGDLGGNDVYDEDF